MRHAILTDLPGFDTDAFPIDNAVVLVSPSLHPDPKFIAYIEVDGAAYLTAEHACLQAAALHDLYETSKDSA